MFSGRGTTLTFLSLSGHKRKEKTSVHVSLMPPSLTDSDRRQHKNKADCLGKEPPSLPVPPPQKGKFEGQCSTFKGRRSTPPPPATTPPPLSLSLPHQCPQSPSWFSCCPLIGDSARPSGPSSATAGRAAPGRRPPARTPAAPGKKKNETEKQKNRNRTSRNKGDQERAVEKKVRDDLRMWQPRRKQPTQERRQAKDATEKAHEKRPGHFRNSAEARVIGREHQSTYGHTPGTKRPITLGISVGGRFHVLLTLSSRTHPKIKRCQTSPFKVSH